MDLNKEMAIHGRGIMMAVSTFDEVSYSGKGNKVTLVKMFNAVSTLTYFTSVSGLCSTTLTPLR